MLTNNNSKGVKQERHDEAEIQELAAKMVEANKAKMATPARSTIPSGVTGMNILNYINSPNKGKTNSSPTSSTNESVLKNIDEESLKGRFGWITVGKSHIPYIIRGNESYCSVRMVELKVLNKYLTYLHQDIYNCTCIRSYYITEAESRLLNEINIKHCDCQFGRDQFTTRDLIVRLTDANEFYKFLSACYAKLVNGEVNAFDRCGFIRINKESVVPYTIYNDQKYVPLFYFEGETDNLKQKADKLEGWDLSYLKFCCKVQGIRNELFAHDSCSVISLNDIKNYFPPGTLFEDYWPKKNMDSQLLISNNSRAAPQMIQWTRQPTAPPASPKLANQPKIVTPGHNVHVFPNYQPTYHGQAARTASAQARPTYQPQAAQPRHVPRPGTYYNNMTQAPPPLVRASQSQPAYNNSQTNSANNYMILGDSLQQSAGYHQVNSQMSKYPPPLVDVRHMNGGMTPSNIQNNYANQTQLINQQPAHQSSPIPQAQTPTEDRNNVSNGRMALNNLANRKITNNSDAPSSGNHIPYKMQKALVEGKMIPCINMKPFVTAELLVTLPDIISNFFNNVSVQSLQQVMQVLGIEVYKPNDCQIQVLVENGKYQSANDTVPLVQVRNVIDFMPQMKYMLGASGIVGPEIATKRTRNS